MRGRRLLGAVAALLGTLVLAGSAHASLGVTELVSKGQIGGNGVQAANFRGSSTDGSKVFFTTAEQLVSGDTDSAIDLYERSGGTTTLLSAGSINGNGSFSVTYGGASADGAKVFFRTSEKLVSADIDTTSDIYMRSGGTTTLVSLGPNGGNANQTVVFKGNTADGTHVFFETAESLITADTDTARDVYQWLSGTVTRISGGNNSSFDAFYEGSSADGTHVFFTTDESLLGSDTDTFQDVYERFNGNLTHVSIGPAGGNGNIDFDYDAFFDGVSADGTKVWIDTDETLTFDDTDTSFDVYERVGATITRISTGSTGGNDVLDAFFDGAAADGSHVFFDTYEALTAADTDFSPDIYDRSGGTTTLASIGPNGGNGGGSVSYAGTNSAGTLLTFSTPESLIASDTDTFDDLYQRSSGGTTTQVSSGNGPNPAFFAGQTSDGSHVYFITDEQVAAADTDADNDLYERFSGATSFISTGPNSTNQDFLPPTYNAVSQDGSKVFYSTMESLLNTDTDAAQDIYAAVPGTAGGFPRPKGATPMYVALVPAYTVCGAPNRTHGPSWSFQSCNPPVQTSSLLTIGTPDANGAGANSNNSKVVLKALGTAGGVDDSDVQISVAMTDVRKTSDLTDYTGELQSVINLRLTDKDPINSLPQTAAIQPLKTTVPCAATVSDLIGAACNITTTADTLIPGMVPEGKRNLWELGQIQVLDGGPDGLASTAGNTVFEVQGLFVP